METGLILRVPEAEPLVGDLRASLDPNAAEGVPAHVTVLYPFRPSEQIDAAVKTCLTKIFRGTPVFDVRFRDVGRFSGVLWLAPEPRAHIDALTRACVAAFPDCLPYAGRFARRPTSRWRSRRMTRGSTKRRPRSRTAFRDPSTRA